MLFVFGFELFNCLIAASFENEHLQKISSSVQSKNVDRQRDKAMFKMSL